MRQLNEAVYNTIYKTIREVTDMKEVRRYGVADISDEIQGIFKMDVSNAYDAHEGKADRGFTISGLEEFKEEAEYYGIKITTEQGEQLNADPHEYHSEYDPKVGDLLEEAEAVSDCVATEYSYTHELDGYEIAIVSREYDTFVELYDEENEEQIDRVDDGKDTDNLAARLEYYFSKEIDQACNDFFNNEVLPEFSDAVKKVYKREFKRYYSDELEENIEDLITVEEDLSYYLEDDVDEATLINFKRQIKDLQKTAPADGKDLKREHKNKSGDCVTIQYTDALAKACEKLGVDVDDYIDKELHDDYECTEGLSEYIDQEEQRANNK